MDKKELTVADLEKLKLLAEELLRLKKDVKELNAMIKDIIKDTEVAFNEPLAEGGRITYELIAPKPRIDYPSYSQYLFTLLNRGEQLTKEEMELVIEQFVVHKDPKWKLTIKK